MQGDDRKPISNNGGRLAPNKEAETETVPDRMATFGLMMASHSTQ